MRTSLLRLSCILALALAGAEPASAKLYKWVDAHGNVTYSERKPPDAAAEEVKVRASNVSDEEARARLDALNDATQARREQRESEESHVTATQERDARLAKNCEIARENLRILQTNARVNAARSAPRSAASITLVQTSASCTL